MYWKKYTHSKLRKKVLKALGNNINYGDEMILGVPGTYLDPEKFYRDAPFLNQASFLKIFLANPNHIGCHTLNNKKHTGSIQSIFEGTIQLELDLLKICAEEIFKAKPDSYDGYLATGGTEANIQAIWIYRNYFMEKFAAKHEQIAVIYSIDSHYSMPKAANLLGVKSIVLPVNKKSREIDYAEMHKKINKAKKAGIKHWIIVANMATTMFGSVDNIDKLTTELESHKITNYKLHIDAAFGGLIYPIVNTKNRFNFAHPKVTSITIDPHKVLQAPYGTGIFLIRKGFMHYVKTEEAQYIPNKDFTLCGSRSGANAVLAWMILRLYGSKGWEVKMENLIDRTTYLADSLDEMGVKYFRNPYMNILVIETKYISDRLAKKFQLVADSYEKKSKWWKIVVMEHVTMGVLDTFLNELRAERSLNKA
jgi:glutamate/tyrosine decarboxylase-like PLP-dependent enzyme